MKKTATAKKARSVSAKSIQPIKVIEEPAYDYMAWYHWKMSQTPTAKK